MWLIKLKKIILSFEWIEFNQIIVKDGKFWSYNYIITIKNRWLLKNNKIIIKLNYANYLRIIKIQKYRWIELRNIKNTKSILRICWNKRKCIL